MRTSRARTADLRDVYRAVVVRCPSKYQTTGVILDADLSEISYTISTAGTPFFGLQEVLRQLYNIDADVYIASGDSMRSLLCLADYGFQPDQIYPLSSPRRKRDIVVELKQNYEMVVMVGDGLNDLQALTIADLGVLTIQQSSSSFALPLPSR